MAASRTIQFKKQHIIALVAVIVAGLVVGQLVGWWAGIAAAVVVLAVNEVVERRARSRR